MLTRAIQVTAAAQNALNGRSHVVVAVRIEELRHAARNLAQRGYVRAGDRHPRGHGLQHRHTEAIERGRIDEGLCAAIQLV
jgi:integrase